MDCSSKCSCSCFERSAFEKHHLLWGSSRSKLFLFPLRDFLLLATHLPQELCSAARNLYAGGIRFCFLPYLEVGEVTPELYSVAKHQGRHRATVLRENGYETMPVRVILPKETPDEAPWPKTIKAQEDAKDPDFTIPLPSPLTLDP